MTSEKRCGNIEMFPIWGQEIFENRIVTNKPKKQKVLIKFRKRKKRSKEPKGSA